VSGSLVTVSAAARAAGRLLSRAAAAALLFLIRAYQSIHVAFFRGSCRFHPTCSHYALEAIQLHGPGRGTLLAAARVLRCQPFCRGGFDPVPEPKRKAPDAAGDAARVAVSSGEKMFTSV
jgi:putative membrane protein insertion efficiency factor